MRLSPAVIVAALLVGAPACTSSPTPVTGPVSLSTTAAPRDSRSGLALTGTPSTTECGWGDGPATDVPEYRGMTLAAAKKRATSEGLKVRDQGADGECFPVTQEYMRTGRINFYSERGVVMWAQLY